MILSCLLPKLILLISLFSFAFATNQLHKHPFNERAWYCGVDLITELLAKQAVTSLCTTQEYNLINKCCYTHDNCYGLKKGQQKCDKEFCNCLKVGSKECKVVALGFCIATESHGEKSYMGKKSEL
uniref:Phospholipase A(2) n=1 Tax=Rhabditophanes sp. KR3021 TaxID=114890 RepID=A0AC35UFQ1_9BILA